MFGLFNPGLYLYFLVFLLAVLFSWLIPGWVTLRLVNFKNITLKFLLAMPVGMAIWGFQGYLFGYGQIRFLTYLYIIFFAWLFYKEQRNKKFNDFKKIWQELKKQKLWFVALIGLSAIFQIFGHIGSGLMNEIGLPLFFVNAGDGVMHLSYIQEIVRYFPPQEPSAIGLPLQNYHYWSDLVQADLIRVWRLPTIHVFFQYTPLLTATWVTILFLRLIIYLGGSKKAVYAALFLITFGGDASYIITQILHGHWGTDVASLDSGVTFYFNIPQVFARFVFLAVLFLFTKWWKDRSIKSGFLLIVLIASLFGFKVYYAIYTVFGFCFVIGMEMISILIKNLKKSAFVQALSKTLTESKKSIFLVVTLAIISLMIYLPVNKGAGGLTFSFFEWPHLLLSADNIDYIDWFLRMQVYEAFGNTRNIIIFNLWAVLLTFIAVYGTRMLGIWLLFKTKNENLKRLCYFFIPTNILFILLGLFTLQTSGGLNIFNFLIVPILSFNIFAALNLSQLKTKFFVPVFFIFALLTIPRTFLQLKMFYQRYTHNEYESLVTKDELEAYKFLQEQKNAVVQKSLKDHFNYLSNYVSFFSQQPSYMGGISMLESHNQPTVERLNQVEDALAQSDSNLKIEMLRNYGITHFLVPTNDFSKPSLWPATAAFQNETWTVVDLRN